MEKHLCKLKAKKMTCFLCLCRVLHYEEESIKMQKELQHNFLFASVFCNLFIPILLQYGVWPGNEGNSREGAISYRMD